MRVNLDSRALKDPRFRRMAKALGINWHEALGLCVEAWMFAYEQRSEYLSAEDVDSVVGRDGVGNAMLVADLAELEGDQLRLRGVRSRIGYLLAQSKRGRAGGKASAAKRQAKKAKAGPRLEANAQQGLKRDPSDQDQDQDQVPDQALVPDLVLVPDQPAPKPNGSSAARPRGEGTSRAIAFFADQYKQKYGRKCTVTTKGAGQIKRLVDQHTAPEVERRTVILFTAPPSFLASSPPDIGTLAQHFDKLVAPSSGGSSPARHGSGRAEPASADQHAADVAKGATPW